MCEPATIMAAASLALGAASTGMSAAGAISGAKTAKAQARLNAANFAQQSMLANYNAGQILSYAKINKNLVLGVSGLNANLTQGIADSNLAMLNATTDFNIGVIKATTDFNVSSAEGAARLLEARGDAEAASHRFNADVSEMQAQDTLEAGQQAERQSRLQYAGLKGQQRARLAANGVALDEGSALRIQSDTDYTSDLDASTIKSNAIKQAFGYRVQAVNETAAADFASLDAKGQALSKRAEAAAARINGQVGVAQAQIDNATKGQDIKTTASVQILQNRTNAAIEAINIDNQAESDAWAARASALGYSGQAAQARLTANSISPFLSGATSLVSGAASLATSAYGMTQNGSLAWGSSGSTTMPKANSAVNMRSVNTSGYA